MLGKQTPFLSQGKETRFLRESAPGVLRGRCRCPRWFLWKPGVTDHGRAPSSRSPLQCSGHGVSAARPGQPNARSFSSQNLRSTSSSCFTRITSSRRTFH